MNKKGLIFDVVLGLIIVLIVTFIMFFFFSDLKGILGGWNVDSRCTLSAYFSSKSNVAGNSPFSLSCTPDFLHYSPQTTVPGISYPKEIVDLSTKVPLQDFDKVVLEYVLANELKKCWLKMGSGHFTGLFSNWFWTSSFGGWNIFKGLENVFGGVRYCMTCAVMLPEDFPKGSSFTYSDFYSFSKKYHFAGSKNTIFQDLTSGGNYYMDPYWLLCGLSDKPLPLNQTIYVMFIKKNQNDLVGLTRVSAGTAKSMISLGGFLNSILLPTSNSESGGTPNLFLSGLEKNTLKPAFDSCYKAYEKKSSGSFTDLLQKIDPLLDSNEFLKEYIKNEAKKSDQSSIFSEMNKFVNAVSTDNDESCVVFTNLYKFYVLDLNLDKSIENLFLDISNYYNFVTSYFEKLEMKMGISNIKPGDVNALSSDIKRNYGNIEKFKGAINSAIKSNKFGEQTVSVKYMMDTVNVLSKNCNSAKNNLEKHYHSSVGFSPSSLDCDLWDLSEFNRLISGGDQGYGSYFNKLLKNPLLNAKYKSLVTEYFYYKTLDGTTSYGAFQYSYVLISHLYQIMQHELANNKKNCGYYYWSYASDALSHLVSAGLVPSLSGTLFGDIDTVSKMCTFYVTP